jgi:hypothetical protein
MKSYDNTENRLLARALNGIVMHSLCSRDRLGMIT